MKVNKVDNMWKYVVFAYLLFWIMILGLGGIASMVLKVSSSTMRWVTVLCSWSPTFVLLVMLKKLMPDTTIRGFYKKAFSAKLHVGIFAITAVLEITLLVLSVAYVSSVQREALFVFIDIIPTSLATTVFFTALQGPSGEESGWRGYLREALEQRYGFLKGNFILGIVWAFWHMPLWFVSCEYAAGQLLIYILSNIVCLTAFTVIIGVCMKKCNNLLLAFWMHFWFNFSLTLYIKQEVYTIGVLAMLYMLVAMFLAVVYLKKQALVKPVNQI